MPQDLPHCRKTSPLDDDEAGGRGNPNTGLIELKLFRAEPIGQSSRKPAHRVSLDTGPVSEKSKKAGWHQVEYVSDSFSFNFHLNVWPDPRLGPERLSRFKPSEIKYASLDSPNRPFMTFRFLYRPRGSCIS